MKKNILFVVNPISGDLDKSDLIAAVQEFSVAHHFDLEVYETTGQHDQKEIQILYNQYHPERIVVAGGDGTIKMVSEAMEKHNVILGILPAGSANGLAAELNLITSLDESLSIAFHNNYIEMDMVVINGKKSMHLSDLGLNAALVKNYEKSDIRGMWGYALQAITTLIDLDDPFTATICANNQTWLCDARMVVIANAKKYGTGVVINPDGVINDGKFELVILKNLDLVVFVKIITGNLPLNSDDIEIISTDKATIKTNFPVSFQIDGEYCGTETELDIKISSSKIKVAIP